MIKAAAMATAEVADELTLIDFLDQNPNPQKPPQKLLEELLDSSVDTFSGLSPAKNSSLDGGGELNEEEEELEWLSNKDAFPSLETSFEIPSTSTSPVSVLAPPPLFKVPVKKRSKIHQKKRRDFPRIAREVSRGRRRCRHCEAEETPQWRMGPDGPKTLCNACGVRFKKGRLFPEYRPANSPTFSAEIHSNSTRKILEMRTGTARTAARRGRPKPVVM